MLPPAFARCIATCSLGEAQITQLGGTSSEDLERDAIEVFHAVLGAEIRDGATQADVNMRRCVMCLYGGAEDGNKCRDSLRRSLFSRTRSALWMGAQVN